MTEQSRGGFATPAQALWEQREVLEKAATTLRELFEAVGRPGDLALYQWGQLFAATLQFEPDLILELGRYRGNSTCVFTEASRWMGTPARILSLDLSDEWERATRPKLEQIVAPSWFEPLEAQRADILTFDFRTALAKPKRIFVFWDAHGFAVAECMLGEVLPLMVDRPHVVVVHDMSDTRYTPPSASAYAGTGLWKGGNNIPGRRVRLGHIDSAVEQAIAITDFAQRNEIELYSADHSLNTGLEPEQLEELRIRLGPDLISQEAHWLWFSLYGMLIDDCTFPRYLPPHREPLTARMRHAIRALLGRRSLE